VATPLRLLLPPIRATQVLTPRGVRRDELLGQRFPHPLRFTQIRAAARATDCTPASQPPNSTHGAIAAARATAAGCPAGASGAAAAARATRAATRAAAARCAATGA
jgi:hypothetical protein